jgi:DNA-binding NtrC family response regulator
VRELRNFVERLVALGPAEALAATVATALEPGDAVAGDASSPAALLDLSYKEAREVCVRQMERAYVTALLERHGGQVTAAALAAGLDRTYLHRLRRRYGV